MPASSSSVIASVSGVLARVLALAALAAACTAHAWDVDRLRAAATRTGPRAIAGAQALPPFVAATSDLDEPSRLQAVNEFYNRRILFRGDAEVWSQPDYWASPLEMLEKGAGDCEDYAIAKYFTLVATGVPVQRLRLVYVRAQIGGPGGTPQAHMVLAYYGEPAAEPLILDNLIGEVRTASRRPDLTPVFSFNSQGLWQGTGSQTDGDPQARLSRWREVLRKAQAEGFL